MIPTTTVPESLTLLLLSQNQYQTMSCPDPNMAGIPLYGEDQQQSYNLSIGCGAGPVGVTGPSCALLVGFIASFFLMLLYQFILALPAKITAGRRKTPTEGKGAKLLKIKRIWRTTCPCAIWQSPLGLLWSFGVGELLVGALSARLHDLD